MSSISGGPRDGQAQDHPQACNASGQRVARVNATHNIAAKKKWPGIGHFFVTKVRNEMEQQNMIVGYARVSTDGQTLQAQTEALHTVGCAKIFAEKISGVYSDRPQLAKAIAALGEGDTLVVCKLDRLARSTRDLLNTLDTIAKAGASFRSLADPWCDTTTPHGKLMTTVLGGLAEFERHLILARTAEGRTRAQANGVRFGRKPTLTPFQRAEAQQRRNAGETLVSISRSFNVSHTTIARATTQES
jgi:DNA invertase Pin-like site-specific DNA recombinase